MFERCLNNEIKQKPVWFRNNLILFFMYHFLDRKNVMFKDVDDDISHEYVNKQTLS